MTTSRTVTALAALFCVVASADAQPFLPGSSGFYSGGGFNYTRVRGRSALNVGFNFGRFGFYSDPFFSPIGVRSTNITVVNINPSPPVIVVPQPIIINQPQPIFLAPPPQDEAPIVIRVPQKPPLPEVPPVPLPEVPKVPEKEQPKKEAPPPKPRPERELPARPGPEDDPRDEYARLMRLGRELFAEGEYGRAATRFRQAIRLDATQFLPHFLLAQALLTQGNYHDAHDAIVAGLKRKPDWPKTKFRPRELYGANVDEYTNLLLATERTQLKHPGDPVMLLLRGYVLWFDGRKEQAAVLFRKSLRGGDRATVERFLAALPDQPL